MAKTPEEKEQGMLTAISNCKSLDKLTKFKIEGASQAVADAFAAKRIELEAAPPAPAKNEPSTDLITVAKDGEEIKIHPDAEADHKRLGWVRV